MSQNFVILKNGYLRKTTEIMLMDSGIFEKINPKREKIKIWKYPEIQPTHRLKVWNNCRYRHVTTRLWMTFLRLLNVIEVLIGWEKGVLNNKMYLCLAQSHLFVSFVRWKMLLFCSIVRFCFCPDFVRVQDFSLFVRVGFTFLN